MLKKACSCPIYIPETITCLHVVTSLPWTMALRVLGESASLDNFNRWLHLVKSCYLAMWFTSSDCQRKDLYEPYKFKSQIVTEGCDLALVAKKMLRSKTCRLDLLCPNTTRKSSPAKSPQPCPLDTLLNTPSNRRELKKHQEISSVPKNLIKLLSKQLWNINFWDGPRCFGFEILPGPEQWGFGKDDIEVAFGWVRFSNFKRYWVVECGSIYGCFVPVDRGWWDIALLGSRGAVCCVPRVQTWWSLCQLILITLCFSVLDTLHS